MRLNRLSALIAALLAFVQLSLVPAQAFDHDRVQAPRGWVAPQPVRHWVYYPRYRHHYLTNGAADPYGYAYEPRGYYPYYNSGYWKHRSHVVRPPHYTHPTYHKAWGANRKHYKHYRWHAKHHGQHDRSHW